jgi:uncharacterized protein (DUF952 family)
MSIIYHITTQSAWTHARALGTYAPPSLTAEGFVHCSRKEQVIRVANTLYRSREDLIVLAINITLLQDSQVREDCTESGEVFPHIYGPVPTQAIDHHINLEPCSDGTFDWPESRECETELLDRRHDHLTSGAEVRYPRTLA